MTLIGVDINSTRARAVHGTVAGPASFALEGIHPELPLAINLEDRNAAVGRAGLSICRRLSHLACLDFLPHLGTKKQWSAGRHQLDAAAAFSLICQHLQPRFARSTGIVLALPCYLTDEQAEQATRTAEKARWKVSATVSAALVAAYAAREQMPGADQLLVVDVDGHALTFARSTCNDDRLRVMDKRAAPRLGMGSWMRALLDGVAHRCVRTSRRDPRASADSEQSLHDQLLAILAAGPRGGLIELNLQGPQWSQNLMLPVDDLATYAASLVEQAALEFQDYQTATASLGPVDAVIVTASAARLPGMVAALGRVLELRPLPGAAVEGDFGEGLIEGAAGAQLLVLDEDAVARAAFELAGLVHRGDVARGRLDEIPAASPSAGATVDAGPARLHFRGKDHLLRDASFVLGRDLDCDLVFETDLYPSVSARHCEIVREGGAYLLRDKSRHGTLVNDHPVHLQIALRPGDWIRLGPGGPLLRFLGQSGDPFRLVTTA